MESSARTRNAFLTVVGVLAAIVLVAVASRGSTSLGDDAARKPSDALTDILFALYLVALIGGAAMFVYLLVLQRKVKAQTGKAPPRSLRQMLGTMLVLAAVGLLMARRLSTWQRPAPVEPEEAIGQAQSIPTHTSRQPTAGSLESEVSWGPVLVTLGLVLLDPRVFGPASSWVLRKAGREPLPRLLATRPLLGLLGWYAGIAVLGGLGIWLLVRSAAGAEAGGPAFVGLAFLLSFAVSMIAFIFPSGLGVREGAFALALAQNVPGSVAVALSVGARLVLSLVELAFIGAVVLLERRRR